MIRGRIGRYWSGERERVEQEVEGHIIKLVEKKCKNTYGTFQPPISGCRVQTMNALLPKRQAACQP